MKKKHRASISVPPLPFEVSDDGRTAYTKTTLTATEEERRARLSLSWEEQRQLTPRLVPHEDSTKFDDREERFLEEVTHGVHSLFDDYGITLDHGQGPTAEHWRKLAIILAMRHGDLNIRVDGEPIPVMVDQAELDLAPSIVDQMGNKTEAVRHEHIGQLMGYYFKEVERENPSRRKVNKTEVARRVAKRLIKEFPKDYPGLAALTKSIRSNHNMAANAARPVSAARYLFLARVSFAYQCVASVAESLIGRDAGKRSPGSYRLPDL